MQVDHIFIFSRSQGQEADELVDFGFSEGSSRVHPGQGTVNRKFYFENFFLEILWVENEEEARSERTGVTGLWERSVFYKNDHSPFGLCLVNTPETDLLFAGSQQYQPEYFPEGLTIDFINNTEAPQNPWLFRLPFKGPKKATEEPTDHQPTLRNLTKTVFSMPDSAAFGKLIGEGPIAVAESEAQHLKLEFDHGVQGNEHHFDSLSLSIVW